MLFFCIFFMLIMLNQKGIAVDVFDVVDAVVVVPVPIRELSCLNS